MMAGLRERKKEETRRRISEVALRLFDERGYDAVTVNEVAEAAGVAKVTLFAYFPSKDCLVLDAVKDDTAALVAGRAEGQSPLGALRAHYRGMAARGTGEVDVEGLMTRIRVISSSPALLAGVHQTNMAQRHELAAALAGAGAGRAATLLAAQVTAAITTLQESFFHRLSTGVPLEEAGRLLGEEVELAFDLLEHGFSSIEGDDS
ncbi:TetR/AcrR family transcriptional regulator [Nonomuraea gerenzanensis]|uniref:Transcriptional regulator, TetR family n=1 Tax=Nonomuraea gerenzanensis TaxID=93944 RepID=A0A1M4E6R0_9ACTN|nr:TetR/AcrR family transcriptional regulator [Nonomuraea gerenzanensis]UBU16715.1 TetR/AcrR family transcriptional regulator [Nonomuraea gerenzanensis]SBO94418.1 Transcriptional regulator, TetR family [Nonomuraea gerenzanensis]